MIRARKPRGKELLEFEFVEDGDVEDIEIRPEDRGSLRAGVAREARGLERRERGGMGVTAPWEMG